ncbi:MAG: TetR/AcrR family transcriptional regulator, partial [Demequina sp.]|nr:TetR/AcrR family transcriptional regulator [Demequina sp.]
MDVRVGRTRKRLQAALFALARERGLEEISVSDIAEYAGVNRSTFYQHYSDKETVLADALDALAAEAGAQLEAIVEWTLVPPAPLVTFLEHVEANADLYRGAFSHPGSTVVLSRLRENISLAVHDLADRRADQTVPLDMVAAGVAGTVIGVMSAWMARDPLPPARDAAVWIWLTILGPPQGGAAPVVPRV